MEMVHSARRKGAYMPRTKTGKGAGGAGSIRKITTTKNGKTYTYWQGRYTEGFDPGTGKQIQRSITGKTQKEVAQKLRQITASLDDGTYKAPCKLTGWRMAGHLDTGLSWWSESVYGVSLQEECGVVYCSRILGTSSWKP